MGPAVILCVNCPSRSQLQPGVFRVDAASLWHLVLCHRARLAGFAFLVLYILMLSVMMSAVQGIFNAALYRYGCFKQVPAAFDADLVKSAWAAKT